MGILRASYLMQNIGGNVDIFLQNKRKLTSIVVICRPCSFKWGILANIGDFEGLAFGVYLSVIRGRLSGSRHSHDPALVSKQFDVTGMPMAPTPSVRILNRLLFNGVQSERGNQRDGCWLAHENLLRISTAWKV